MRWKLCHDTSVSSDISSTFLLRISSASLFTCSPTSANIPPVIYVKALSCSLSIIQMRKAKSSPLPRTVPITRTFYSGLSPSGSISASVIKVLELFIFCIPDCKTSSLHFYPSQSSFLFFASLSLLSTQPENFFLTFSLHFFRQ